MAPASAEGLDVEADDRAEFGRHLRAARGMTGLRSLVKKQERQPPGSLVISRAQLSRYERGEVLPSLDCAAHIDWLYEAGGWAEMRINTLRRPRWHPWKEEEGPRLMHSGSWPADFAGTVWLKVVPNPSEVNEEHELLLEWGPWLREVHLSLPATGVVLRSGKARDDDGIRRTLNFAADRAVHVLFGAGEGLVDEEVVDIRRGWRLVDRGASDDERTHGPARGGVN